MNRPHDVTLFTTAELERAKRDLKANLGLITPDSPAHVPIQAQMRAIDTELAERAGNQHARKNTAVTAGTDPPASDPMAALAREYDAQWNVWKPGLYVADHRHLDVSLKSDTIPGLADKLRQFTELVRDLP
jgi:hypothetical protein